MGGCGVSGMWVRVWVRVWVCPYTAQVWIAHVVQGVWHTYVYIYIYIDRV